MIQYTLNLQEIKCVVMCHKQTCQYVKEMFAVRA